MASAAEVERRPAHDGLGALRRQADLAGRRIRRILASDRASAERVAGPSKRKRAAMVVPTEQRLMKGDLVEWINPAEIDSSEQPIGLTRRFRSSALDRLYRSGKLTWTQWYAGDWYRNQHAKCSFALSVVGGYEVRTSATEPSYGLPRTEAQARARGLWMQARAHVGAGEACFMDRFLIEDDYPALGGGKQRAAAVARVGLALDRIGRFLQLPGVLAA